MSSRIVWKLVATLVVLAFAIFSLLPIESTDFRTTAGEMVTNNPEAFEALVADADARIEERAAEGETISFYVAFRDLVNERNVDLWTEYFPEIRAGDTRNIERRNEIILDEILANGRAALRPGLDLQGGVAFTLEIAETDLSQNQGERTEQLDKAVEIVTRRVDGLGVAEPVIRVRGESAIEVQMPGLSLQENPGAVDDIGKPALLEFTLVHRTIRPPQAAPPGFEAKILRNEERDGSITQIPYYVKIIPEMTGGDVAEAGVVTNETGGFEVSLNFTGDGGGRFARLTRRIAEENEATNSVGQLAIILDDELYSAPTVRQEISGGRASISGRFTQREAFELANVLNNPLEFGLERTESYEVGPTLASSARVASIEAAILGAILVVLFTLIFYQAIGAVAVVSISVAMFLVLGILGSLGATLTLPGIAALILTIGMAVDANILIFERMREELKLGKSMKSALSSGYEKALSTIVDANVTTMITALILILLGTGPVKGFGITLAIGIGSSVFCALVVSRMLLEFLVSTGLLKKGFRFSILSEKNFSFLDYSRPAFLTSWVIVLIGVGVTVFNWNQIFGIDFTGGDEILVAYEEAVDPDAIRDLAETTNFGEVIVTNQASIGVDETFLKIQTQFERGNEFFALMQENFPTNGLELAGTTEIGPSVGQQVKWSAVISLSVALVLMLFYIALRFEVGYGVGAVVATIHDILMTIGLYVLLDGQFTAPMVASILMVVGYSINDTIVVFDRIREELDLNPGMNLRKVIHLAINRVLSRTILTSVTTALATIALLIFAAGVITDFALVFLIGILTGTFSSIFIASPVFYWWHKGDRRHVEERRDVLPKYDWEAGNKKSDSDSEAKATT